MAKNDKSKSSSKPNPKNQGKSASSNKRGQTAPYKRYSGSRQDKRAEEIADTGAAMSRENPIETWNKFRQFADDAARIPFARVVGNTYDLSFKSAYGTEFTAKTADPGLMRIVFSPSVGVSEDYTSPLNRSSINFYGRLRSTQRAFNAYDHQDLTMMILALDSCVMFHALGRKIYGTLTSMTPINRYYPRALVGACGVSFPDTQKTIQDFRAWLNEFALQIEQYAIPDNIELLKRHQWMCEGLYTDSTATRAQTYMFVPAGFWKYNNTVATGSELEYVQYIKPGETAATQYTIEEFQAIGNSLINAISNDEDFARISGDLYAYYGGNVMKLPYVDEHYQILPRYDERVLSQIENATIMGWWASGYTPVISQNPNVNQGAIVFTPQMQVEAMIPLQLQMNMHIDSPSTDDVIEATRLMCAFAPDIDSEYGVALSLCGTEIVHCLDIFVTNPTTMGIRSRRLQQPVYSIDEAYMAGDNAQRGWEYIQNQMNDILWLQKFDWAPRITICHFNNSLNPTGYQYNGNTWDIDNSIIIPENFLNAITTACLYSVFNVETR